MKVFLKNGEEWDSELSIEEFDVIINAHMKELIRGTFCVTRGTKPNLSTLYIIMPYVDTVRTFHEVRGCKKTG